MNFIDKQLVKKAKTGDKQAFTDLVNEYKDKIYNLAYRMLGNKQEAEDISQDTFLRVYSNLDKYDETHKFSTWIYRIASNLSIDRIRKKKPSVFLDAEWKDEEGLDWYSRLPNDNKTPEEELLLDEQQRLIQEALLSLPEKYRLIMILKYMEDRSIQEISTITDTSLATVKTRLHRGREYLRKQLLHNEMEQGRN